MKDTLKPGLQHTVEIEIDAHRTIDFMGDDLRVYATPSIVHDLEYACRNFILEHLDDGEDTVGAKVEIEHARPTPLGFTVTHTVTIEEVDGRRIIVQGRRPRWRRAGRNGTPYPLCCRYRATEIRNPGQEIEKGGLMPWRSNQWHLN